jgi:RNA polymerase sigma factor (sigma-70 family)
LETSRPTIESICQHDLWFIRYVLLRYKVPLADVDDVVQGLLLSVHRSLPSYDPSRASLHTWLFCIARRAAVVHLRKLHAQAAIGAAVSAGAVSLCSPDGAAYAEAVRDPAPDGEEKMIEEEQRKFLYEALGRMDPKRRETFDLHALGGLSDAEVAKLLEIPKNTVKSRIAQARRELEASATKLRARERRRLAGIVPLSAAAVLSRERERIALISDGAHERLWHSFQRAHAPEAHGTAGFTQARARSAGRRSAGVRTARLLPRHVSLRVALALSFGAAVAGGVMAAAVVWTATRPAPSAPPPASKTWWPRPLLPWIRPRLRAPLRSLIRSGPTSESHEADTGFRGQFILRDSMRSILNR